VAKFMSRRDKKTAAGAYVRVAIALNSDNSPKAQKLQLRYLGAGQHIYHDLDAQAEEAGTLNALGEYYLRRSEVKAAIEHFNKAYDFAQKAKADYVAAEALSGLGNAYQAQKDFSRAGDFHKRAAGAYHDLKNPSLEAFCLQNLARDYSAMNETDESLSAFLEAKAVAARAPALNQYFVNLSLGQFYREQGQFEKSLATFRESVEVTKQAGDVEHCAYSHLAIAELDGLIGGWEDAVGEAEIALSLFKDIGDKETKFFRLLTTESYKDIRKVLKGNQDVGKEWGEALELAGSHADITALIEVEKRVLHAEARRDRLRSPHHLAQVRVVGLDEERHLG